MEKNGSHADACTRDPLSCQCRSCITDRKAQAKVIRLAELMDRLEKAGISVEDLSELLYMGRRPEFEPKIQKMVRDEMQKVIGKMVQAEVYKIIAKRPSAEVLVQRILRKMLGGK